MKIGFYRSAALAAALAVICLVSRAQLPISPDIAVQMDPIKVKLNEKDQERDYRSDIEILAQDVTERGKGWHFEKLVHGDRSRKVIALTIDDGPHPKFTPQLLAALKEAGVPATFFVIGEEAQFNPGLIRAQVAGGHEVSNHTYHHARLNHVLPELIRPEIEACDAVIQAITGKPADGFLRPPGGEYDADVVGVCKSLGKTIVLYTDDPADYANPPKDVLIKRILDAASPGGIILLHDGVQETVDVLPTVVKTLQARGYRFVTVSQLDAMARPKAVRDYEKRSPVPKPRKAGFPRVPERA